ncbi:hypothetical protein SARC_09781 [Sphaeroforma arctica JP610]|uniref:Uncharacterized protein n=1 Tax=Sphaeroforma arctica JP610 TaxID=667725 RepID=A0A0L0FMN3_9EUKA|nr:hypothetical protein SARC_09781 [Sphaeroforma arctica JP610]KNC77766.1 hypothetical protein SARC_09781 [Sphaeroforma arctica JP610]|eukprot:XP_014151668.1 hypothetical protein SARC_09781 [Sphaeroforma arctica JP610]
MRLVPLCHTLRERRRRITDTESSDDTGVTTSEQPDSDEYFRRFEWLAQDFHKYQRRTQRNRRKFAVDKSPETTRDDSDQNIEPQTEEAHRTESKANSPMEEDAPAPTTITQSSTTTTTTTAP